jgi:hypothetical protein
MSRRQSEYRDVWNEDIGEPLVQVVDLMFVSGVGRNQNGCYRAPSVEKRTRALATDSAGFDRQRTDHRHGFSLLWGRHIPAARRGLRSISVVGFAERNPLISLRRAEVAEIKIARNSKVAGRSVA